ncbi:mechanosensitive ion channel family protein, partial [Flavobacteriaceae bacterium]|nr:mechanosensitive ion channel family protein [Flavobacteriaceae bacterium]
MKHIVELIIQLLSSWGLPSNIATNLGITILFIALTIFIYIIDLILKKIIRAAFTKIANKSKTDFDDIMLANRVPSSI